MISLGLMSGTSCDGIDAAIIETDGNTVKNFIAEYHLPYSLDFSKKLLSLMDGNIPFYHIEKELTELHCYAIENILKLSLTKPDVIGFHGQALFHDPSNTITIQIGNPHIIAARFGIKVVSDFRRRDVAYGGQGAPLIPVFHKAIMKDYNFPLAVVNIGGVSNATYINKEILLGYDLGPGNAYINDAMMRHFNKPYDNDGIIAESGIVDLEVVEKFLSDSFFYIPPPKSLDRNHFSFVMKLLDKHKPEDKIATLTMITARAISSSLSSLDIDKIFLCGGGVKNKILVKFLQDALEKIEVQDLASLGFSPDYIEAQGFAFLAARCINNIPSSFSSTTGVKIPTVCGVVF